MRYDTIIRNGRWADGETLDLPTAILGAERTGCFPQAGRSVPAMAVTHAE